MFSSFSCSVHSVPHSLFHLASGASGSYFRLINTRGELCLMVNVVSPCCDTAPSSPSRFGLYCQAYKALASPTCFLSAFFGCLSLLPPTCRGYSPYAKTSVHISLWCRLLEWDRGRQAERKVVAYNKK